MSDQRPKNLNLFTIKFPIPAIVSILHRISGVVLFVSIPAILWLLDQSLTIDGFKSLRSSLNNDFIKVTVWVFLVAFVFHLAAGLRHLLSDIGLGDSLKGGRFSAWLVLFATVILVVLTGIWLW